MNDAKLAGFGKRFMAHILDGIILGVAFVLLLLPFGGIFAFLGMGGADDYDGLSGAGAAFAGMSIVGIILLALVAPIIYDTLLTASPRQGTLGKSIMRIKVVKENGERLTTNDALIRAVVKFISGQFCGLLLMVCLFSDKEQNLHDMAARTYVIED